MTGIVLIGRDPYGQPADGILLPRSVWGMPAHRVAGWRYQRYYSARLAQELRGIVGPPLMLRIRLGEQYKRAWERGDRPNLRFQDTRRTPLTPAPNPARERRRGRDIHYDPPGAAARLAAIVFACLLAMALGRCLGASA
jgi:hypothetical protein